MYFNGIAVCKGGITMPLYDNKDKIERYLDELSGEYKELLLKSLLESTGSIENLSVSDLLRIDLEIKRPLMREYRRKKRMQNMLMKAGIMYAFMGIMLLLLFEMSDSFQYDGMNLVALVLTLVGLLLSLYSSMISNNKYIEKRVQYRESENNRAVMEYNVVRVWKELEAVANDLYFEAEEISISSIIDRFVEDKYVNKSEADSLKQLLKMRNNIVHNTGNNYLLKDLKEILLDTSKILNKLKSIV